MITKRKPVHPGNLFKESPEVIAFTVKKRIAV
jgi:hypothetical protein